MSSQSQNVSSDPSRRGGFTLLEVLIATVATMLMMLSLAVIFRSIGEGMKSGRAALELNNRLRNVTHRIRLDLDNMTVNPNRAVSDASPQNGYMKYFDGSLTDFSAALVSDTRPAENNISRFGDLDDIIMFTARAGDEWYTGKVPLFVLRQAATPILSDPSVDIWDPNGNGIPDDIEMVTIAAQHAEIVMWCEPEVTSVGNPARDTTVLIQDPAPKAVPNYEDINGDGFPDGFRLHYRTLLIRPDLNVPVLGRLGSNLPTAPGEPWLYAGSQTGTLPSGTTYNLPPMCDMARAHAQCDLSIRRIENGVWDFVAANSLDDLVNPANRFAHVQIQAATNFRTMPMLALGRSLPMDYDGDGNSDIFDPDGYFGAGGSNPATLILGSGFLHPAFTLNTGWDATGFGVTAARVGEDVLSTNVLAFDVKAFDPFASIAASAGPDGIAGSTGDDDGSGTADDPSELGWSGSDDLMLSPNDPGFGLALRSAAAGSATAMVIGAGEYVDLGWARKTLESLINYGVTVSSSDPVMPLWSQLSAYHSRAWTQTAVDPPFTDALYRSGQVVQTGGIPQIMQLAYDSYTAGFESDGILQAQIAGTRGVVEFTGAPGALYNDIKWVRLDDNWRSLTGADAATDGIDNNPNTATPGVNIPGPGVDDSTEKETSAPFPVELRGIRVSVRIEDPASRQFNQMTVTKEFVNQ